MKKILIAFSFFLIFSSFSIAQQVKNLYWEPAKPKAGDEITVYTEIDGNVSQVTLKYCFIDEKGNITLCQFKNMELKNGKWTASFKAEDKDIDISIIVNGQIIKEATIEVEKEKKTPSFFVYMIIVAIAIAMIAKIKIRK